MKIQTLVQARLGQVRKPPTEIHLRNGWKAIVLVTSHGCIIMIGLPHYLSQTEA